MCQRVTIIIDKVFFRQVSLLFCPLLSKAYKCIRILKKLLIMFLMLRLIPSFSVSILIRWRNYISQLLNVHGVTDVRHTEIHTAESHVPDPSAFEVELAIENLKSHKSPGIDQIPAKLRQGVEKFTMISINVLFLFGKRGIA